MGILIATLIISVIGLLLGLALATTGRKFYVETDPREAAVRECLPGNNCGACGYAGCDAVAAAIAARTAPANVCPVCSSDAAEKIAAVMGVEAQAAERHVAFVRCGGDCEKTSPVGNYVGVTDCRAATLAGLNPWACTHGCLGFGSCVAACNYEVIRVVNGVAIVEPAKCVGFGLCAASCPKGLIELIPARERATVCCSSPAKGAEVQKLCAAGCLGCGICVKQCPEGAVSLEGTLAHVDYVKCAGCGKCAEKCPTHTIVLTR